jgi:LPS sulfotransferase NodH
MTSDTPVRYFLCSTPRSGSAFVSHVFQQTGRLGLVDEFFNFHSQPRWERDAGAFLDRLLEEKTTPNGVFGIKTHFQEFMGIFLSPLFVRFGSPKLLYLERRDRIRQAISLVKAFRRNWWNTVDSDRPQVEHEYVFDEVLRSLDYILDQYRGWDQLLTLLDVDVFRFAYEDFVEDPVGITMRAAEFLGVEIDTDALEPDRVPVKRQAGASTEDWRERFVADAAARFRTDSLDCFLEMWPYLRWNYPDTRLQDQVLEGGGMLMHSPTDPSLRRQALARLHEAGFLDGTPSIRLDRSAVEAVVRYQRREGLLVEPRLTPLIASRIVAGIPADAVEPDLTGEWNEVTNDAEYGFVSIQTTTNGLAVFCVYRRDGEIVSWSAHLVRTARTRYSGELRHRVDLRESGWKDASLDLTLSDDGMRLAGTVTPRGESPLPIELVRT